MPPRKAFEEVILQMTMFGLKGGQRKRAHAAQKMLRIIGFKIEASIAPVRTCHTSGLPDVTLRLRSPSEKFTRFCKVFGASAE